jgi:hypothetical protein
VYNPGIVKGSEFITEEAYFCVVVLLQQCGLLIVDCVIWSLYNFKAGKKGDQRLKYM